MPHVDKHIAGSFCWMELATTDSAASKRFYTALFGWDTEDQPLGGGAVYTTWKLDGRDAGAMYEQMPQQRKEGIPPHWMLYVASDNVDSTVAQAKALGFHIYAGPFNVMDKGRMAIIADSEGATFAAWQAISHIGCGIAGVPGSFAWGELATSDVPAAATAYSKLFGWTMKPSPEYTEFANQGVPVGGIMALKPEWEAPPNWVAYFHVANCNESTKLAKTLGAGVLAGPMDIPKVGRCAMLQDPQGAAFYLFQAGA